MAIIARDRTALLTDRSLPRGAAWRLPLTIGAAFSLTGKFVRATMQNRHGATKTIYRCQSDGAAITVSGQTITILAEPDAISEITDSVVTLADVAETGLCEYGVEILDEEDGIVLMTIQGNLEWTEPLGLPTGTSGSASAVTVGISDATATTVEVSGTGADGVSAYVYIGYASDDEGADYSDTPGAGLDHIAFLATSTEIETPTAEDFAGLWVAVSGGTSYTHPNHSGDVTSVGDGATTIAANAVTNTKLADMETGTIKARITGSTGDPEDATATQIRTLLNVQDGATDDQTASEILAALVTVDGPASGLDADLLDGNHAAAFLLATLKGVANGLAELDSGGLVPSAQLPSYVDDVIESANFAALPGTGATGKIYVTLDDGLTYRWSGSAYVEISASLALGETSSTAYRGDRGKTAYDHSQVTTGNPHGVTKSDVGLGNCDNTSDADKPVSTATQTALDGKVATTGNETIAGVKTFSSSPVVPAPTTDLQAATKKYVDALAIVTDATTAIELNASNCHPNYIRTTNAGAITATLASGQSAAVGRYWIIRQAAAGATTVAPTDSAAAGITRNGDPTTAGQHTEMAVILVADGVLDIIGGTT